MHLLVLSCFAMFGNIAAADNVDNSSDVKRQADEVQVYTVELLIVADFTVYQYWQEQTPQGLDTVEDTETEVERRIHTHYQAVVNGINVRFSSVDNLVFAIDVVISDVIILKNRSDAIWAESNHSGASFDATKTLSYFRKWKQMTTDLPEFDHAMLFTRYDLTKDGSESVAGLAYTGTMCTDTSLSIVEDDMSSQSYTVAIHELAHSLGSRHDGVYNRCSSEDNFIMSEVTSISGDLQKNRNSWRFSQCSAEYFSEYIRSLNDREANCLTHRARRGMGDASLGNVTNDVTNNVTEAVPSPDTQCERTEGEYSVLCRNLYMANYTDFCALMYCSVDDVTCNFRLPLDGTTCGHNKVCSAGYCVFQNAIVTGESVEFSDRCPFGDQPGALASNLDCEGSIAQKPHLCYQGYYAARCCHSCEKALTSQLGCEYGDKAERCKTVTHIDCLMGDEECCVTCTSYRQTLKGLILPVSAGGAAVVLLLILVCVIVMTRRRRRRRNRNRKSDTDSQTDTEERAYRQNDHNSRLSSERGFRHSYANEAFQDPGISTMNGFRVPGSRHEPMFQYDRQAKLLLSTMLANQERANSWRRDPGSHFRGHDVMFPGSDVMFHGPTSGSQFNLREFGEGARRVLPITTGSHTNSPSNRSNRGMQDVKSV